MFCCTQQQSHLGEIVTIFCKQKQCQQNQQQLCCSVCIQQNHKNHQFTSFKNYLPTLLNQQKQHSKLLNILQQILKQFLPSYYQANQNIVESFRNTLAKTREYIEQTKHDSQKIKQAIKTVQQVQSKSTVVTIPIQKQENFQSQRVQQKKYMSQIPLSHSSVKNSNVKNIQLEWGFSHVQKHSHISLKNLKTVVKSTNSPLKSAVIFNITLKPQQDKFQLKIDRSSGNIMVGFCHEQFVKEKQHTNCYGMHTGTYLIGQNGNDPNSAICFHHSNPTFNRKQIVGWNFFQGDVITLGGNFEEEYVYFKNKSQESEFVLPVDGLQNINSLKLIVLLQNQGDQVTVSDYVTNY